MKKKFSWLCLVLAVLLLLAACGGNAAGTPDQSNEANSGDSEELYEIIYAYPTFDSVPQDIQLVQEEINKITTEKINATVKLMPISNSAFDNQVNLMLTSGEKLDMIAMLGNYSNQVSKGVLYPIGNIMEQHGQGILEALGEEYYHATKVGGVSYGVPSIRDLAQDYGFLIRKDLVDQYQIDVDQVQSFEDFGSVFSAIKQNEPDMVSATNLGGGSILSSYEVHDPLGNDLGVLLNNGLDNLEVVNWFATEEYKQILYTLRDWYEKGYLLKDAATNPEGPQAVIRSGKAAGNFSALKPGFAVQESRQIGREMMVIRTEGAVAKTDTVTNVMLGVTTGSENPEKTLQFLNLMYSDKDIVNLLVWGIEGQHYEKVEGQDNMIKYPEGTDSSNVGYKNYGWMQGNQFLNYVFEGEDPDLYKKMDEFNKSAAKSKALGFSFDPEPVNNEVVASNAVLEQYRRALESGMLDVDKVLPEFLEKLENAGIQKIIDEKQRQLDDWAAANGVE